MTSDDKATRRSRLKEYYGILGDNDPSEQICDPFDFRSPDFNSEMYLNKLLKENNLSLLMDREQNLYKEIQMLDSEMQTLVYENYNKFISATETIQKMSSHFDKMEDELKLLSTRMSEITHCSDEISSKLKGRRNDLSELSSTHSVLKKLQFLFDLAPNMRRCVEEKTYGEAVNFYLQAERALAQYHHFPSIQAINDECKIILDEVKMILYEKFGSRENSPNQLMEIIDLLLQLKESPINLCIKFLDVSGERLKFNLTELDNEIVMCKNQSERKCEFTMDILEFVDLGCNEFLSNLTAIITVYADMFSSRSFNVPETDKDLITDKLSSFVQIYIDQFCDKILQRISIDGKSKKETVIFVRALDRFYKRMHGLGRIFNCYDFSHQTISVIEQGCEKKCNAFLAYLKNKLIDELAKVRHTVGNVITQANSSSSTLIKPALTDLLISLQTTISEQIKFVVAALTAFTQKDVTFASKASFQEKFGCEYVREGVIVNYLRFILSTALEYEENISNSSSPPPQLVLLLSRLCLDMESSIIGYLLDFTDEQFAIGRQANFTPYPMICREAKEVAQKLLTCYVKLEGQNISQMVRKSIDTRDWLCSAEPRSVRSVMKRVVEDVSVIDSLVGQLYEEGVRTERSSDSSRNRQMFSNATLGSKHSRSSNWSAYAASSINSTIDNSVMSNIQKLFSERIEIFGNVQFSKLSVVTGIIKIALKAFLECVRLCTFSKFGLQQIQVDAFYLQTHLWRFVSDENLVCILLEELLISAVDRCFDAVLLESNIVEKICESV